MSYQEPNAKHAITLDDARRNVGRAVIYQAHAGARRERGIITSVGDQYVFVRFDGDGGSKATPPERMYFEQQIWQEPT